jgi:hypothetical protein
VTTEGKTFFILKLQMDKRRTSDNRFLATIFRLLWGLRKVVGKKVDCEYTNGQAVRQNRESARQVKSRQFLPNPGQWTISIKLFRAQNNSHGAKGLHNWKNSASYRCGW